MAAGNRWNELYLNREVCLILLLLSNTNVFQGDGWAGMVEHIHDKANIVAGTLVCPVAPGLA